MGTGMAGTGNRNAGASGNDWKRVGMGVGMNPRKWNGVGIVNAISAHL